MTCNKFFFPNEPIELEDGDRVHVYSWYVRDFLNQVGFPCKIHVVSALGDAPVNAVLTEEELFKILDNPNCLSWTMGNSYYKEHPKLLLKCLYLPNDKKMREYLVNNAERLRSKPKKNEVYYNYTISNMYERLMTPNLIHSMKTYEDYLEELAEYKYAYCPNGVGIEIFKFYDAVVCGVIPIIKMPKDFVRVYDKFNFVCIPGYSAVTYIFGNKDLVDLQESPYIPEKQGVNNSIAMLYEDDPEPLRITYDEWKKYYDKVDFEYFRKTKILLPKNNIDAHVTSLIESKKLNI